MVIVKSTFKDVTDLVMSSHAGATGPAITVAGGGKTESRK